MKQGLRSFLEVFSMRFQGRPNKVKFAPISEYFKMYEKYLIKGIPYEKLFSSSLWVSSNFVQIGEEYEDFINGKLKDHKFLQQCIVKPFDDGFQDTGVSLMLQDKKTNELKLVMLTSDESAFVWNILDLDKNYDPKKQEEFDKTPVKNQMGTGGVNWTGNLENLTSDGARYYGIKKLLNKENRDYRIALVHPQKGIVQQGSEALHVDSNYVKNQFLALNTQAKFFAGYVDYTKEELKYLQHWIEEVGAEPLEQMLTTQILKERSDTQKLYMSSTLCELFSSIKSKKK